MSIRDLALKYRYVEDYRFCNCPARLVAHRDCQGVADAVAAGGVMLPIESPSVNASWEYRFHSPTLKCNAHDSFDIRRHRFNRGRSRFTNLMASFLLQ